MLQDAGLMASPTSKDTSSFLLERSDVRKMFLQVKRDDLQEHWNRVSRAKRNLPMLVRSLPVEQLTEA